MKIYIELPKLLAFIFKIQAVGSVWSHNLKIGVRGVQ